MESFHDSFLLSRIFLGRVVFSEKRSQVRGNLFPPIASKTPAKSTGASFSCGFVARKMRLLSFSVYCAGDLLLSDASFSGQEQQKHEGVFPVGRDIKLSTSQSHYINAAPITAYGL
jgi:hypothetical protein